jgi:hypothetical protein
VSCGLLKELQARIAFACYDSPTLIKRGASLLSEGAIEDVMTSIFYGDDKNGADPNVGGVDQFMLGLNKFKGLYTQSLQAGPNGASGEALLSISTYLHRHKKLLVYVGDGSIEKGLLLQKSLFGTGEKISGRTLVRMLKVVLCNCKIMMAIVKSKRSPYKDGTFPSGANWEDYILWYLVEMGKECDRGEAEKIDSIVNNKSSKDFGLGDVTGEEEQGGVAVASNSASNLLSAEDMHP